MKQFIINYIQVNPNTSYKYHANRSLILETENNNFFVNSLRLSEEIKSQSSSFHSKFYHLYLPVMQEDNYLMPFETLPFYEGQEKKYVEVITHLGNSFVQNKNLFKKFIQDYKTFLVNINYQKDIMSKVEFIFKHDEEHHYTINEIATTKINNRRTLEK